MWLLEGIVDVDVDEDEWLGDGSKSTSLSNQTRLSKLVCPRIVCLDS